MNTPRSSRESWRSGSDVTSGLLPRIGATGRARLLHGDGTQEIETWLELVPDPLREHLARGIPQTRDLIQEVVVQPFLDRSERGLDLAEIENPPHGRVHRPGHLHANGERVPVEPCAL